MKLPMPVILAVAVLVSGGSGAGAVLLMSKKGEEPGKSAKHKKDKHKDSHGADHAEEEVRPKSVISLDETVINLADKDEMRYLKIAVALGLEKTADEAHMKEALPPLRDAVIGVLARETFASLHTEAGVKKAKKRILEAVNHRIHENSVVAVYFESFAMQ